MYAPIRCAIAAFFLGHLYCYCALKLHFNVLSRQYLERHCSMHSYCDISLLRFRTDLNTLLEHCPSRVLDCVQKALTTVQARAGPDLHLSASVGKLQASAMKFLGPGCSRLPGTCSAAGNQMTWLSEELFPLSTQHSRCYCAVWMISMAALMICQLRKQFLRATDRFHHVTPRYKATQDPSQ